MKVSVAVATYNGAQYLRAQLQSFVEQTRQPDELIVSDDCSTDETESIVREFAKTAPFNVEFHSNEHNLGYCGNFSAALMKTSGDLVFLSDQDDVWFPEKIEYILEVANNNPEVLLIMNDAVLTDGALNEVGLTKVGQMRSAGFSMDAFVMGCCCAVKRELLDLCIPIPVGVGHDTWLVWIADGLGSRIVDKRVLQYYRRHEANASGSLTSLTTRVNKIRAFLYLATNTFDKDWENQINLNLKQRRNYIRALRDIRSKAHEKHQYKLNKLEIRTEKMINAAEKRIALRKKTLLYRIIAVGNLLAKGGYQNTSGLKSVLRDIIG